MRWIEIMHNELNFFFNIMENIMILINLILLLTVFIKGLYFFGLLVYGVTMNVKKIKEFLWNIWIKYFIIKINPNKINFYRAILNTIMIVLVNYLFANEPVLFAQDSFSLDSNSSYAENNKLYAVAKKISKGIKEGFGGEDNSMEFFLFREIEEDPVFPLLIADFAFEKGDYSYWVQGELQWVPKESVYEGPTSFGYLDIEGQSAPLNKKLWEKFYLLEIAPKDDPDWDIEFIKDQVLQRDEISHDPAYLSLYYNNLKDYGQYDSLLFRKLSYQWDSHIPGRFWTWTYNSFNIHPVDTEDYDHSELVENVLDRADLQDAMSYDDFPARYEFFLSLLDRGLETEPNPIAEKIKRRPVEKYVYTTSFTYVLGAFVFFGGPWFMWDQVYNYDHFYEFRSTSDHFEATNYITMSKRPGNAKMNHPVMTLTGWNKDESLEWRVYYRESQIDIARRLAGMSHDNRVEFLSAKFMYWYEPQYLLKIIKPNMVGSQGSLDMRYIREPQSFNVTPVWNATLEEQPVYYARKHLGPRYTLLTQEEPTDTYVQKRLSKGMRAQLTALEEFWESTLMPETWLPLREEWVKRIVSKGGKLKEEYDDEIEEFLAEQLEWLHDLRGLGVGLGKRTEMYEFYDLQNFDLIDFEWLFNHREVEDIL
jgi:hypothetical protein